MYGFRSFHCARIPFSFQQNSRTQTDKYEVQIEWIQFGLSIKCVNDKHKYLCRIVFRMGKIYTLEAYSPSSWWTFFLVWSEKLFEDFTFWLIRRTEVGCKWYYGRVIWMICWYVWSWLKLRRFCSVIFGWTYRVKWPVFMPVLLPNVCSLRAFA